MTSTDAESRPRRDAEATRAAILLAARRAFARRPYTEITVKAIAEAAGVSSPLVIKYFGSKEQLFARIASFEDGIDDFLDAPPDRLGRHMTLFILEGHAHRHSDPILRIAFSLVQGEQADKLRANFKSRVVRRLADRLTGPDALLRAELAIAHLVGLGVVLGVVQAEAARAEDVARVADWYAPGVQALLTGDAPPRETRA
ncbi:TetR family transcriptional regulator [Uniformispora flossi]|uniref:TetR/AcrR family transcriptional regulator n=1 Tax=Uniformispora flossi TaxID=3390723 RepID=UPI003C2E3119